MVEPGDDFDDLHDDSDSGPLLPPDDRLWRHPSELATHAPAVSPEALTARRRWMASTPTRAGVWSAAVVGAVLATGVVLAGTHLTGWLTPTSSAGDHASARQVQVHVPGVVGASTYAPTTISSEKDFAVPTTTIVVHMSRVQQAAESVAAAMPLVSVGRSGERVSGVGIVIRSDGMVLVPYSLVHDASWITVSIANQLLVGRLIGSDAATGLAVVKVNSTDRLPTAGLTNSRDVGPGALVSMVWVEPDAIQVCLGTVAQIDAQLSASAASPPLLEAIQPAMPIPPHAQGAALIDGSGQLVGILTGGRQGAALVTPSWVANVVANELMSGRHRVVRGFLGISGVATSQSGGGSVVQGVKVVAVLPGGAAAAAGLKPGDIIQSVNAQLVTSMSQLVAALYSLPPHTSVVLGLVRDHRVWRADASLTAVA